MALATRASRGRRSALATAPTAAWARTVRTQTKRREHEEGRLLGGEARKPGEEAAGIERAAGQRCVCAGRRGGPAGAAARLRTATKQGPVIETEEREGE